MKENFPKGLNAKKKIVKKIGKKIYLNLPHKCFVHSGKLYERLAWNYEISSNYEAGHLIS